MHEGSKVERAAVVCDSRGGEYFAALARRDRRARRAAGVAHRVCSSRPTSRRWSTATRRPAGATRSRRRAAWPTASAREQRAARAGPRARRHRDRHHRAERRRRCARKVADELLRARRRPAGSPSRSRRFGHKHGPPRDADLAFDVRFLPNPHYEPDLRAADRLRPADRRLRRRATGAWRSSTSASLPLLEYLLPAVRGRGQGAPGGRDRLHRRAPPLGGDRRAPRPRASATATGLLRRGRAPRRRPRCRLALATP